MYHPIKLVKTVLNNMAIVIKQKNGAVFRPVMQKLNRIHQQLEVSLASSCGLDYWQDLLREVTETLDATKGIVVYVQSTTGMTTLIIENLEQLRNQLDDIIQMGTQSSYATPDAQQAPPDVQEEEFDIYQIKYYKPVGQDFDPEVQLEDQEYELSYNQDRMRPRKEPIYISGQQEVSMLDYREEARKMQYRIVFLEQQNVALMSAVYYMDYKSETLIQRFDYLEGLVKQQQRYLEESSTYLQRLSQNNELQEVKAQLADLTLKMQKYVTELASGKPSQQKYRYMHSSAALHSQVAQSSYFRYPSFAHPALPDDQAFALNYQQEQNWYAYYKMADRRSSSSGRYASKLYPPPSFEDQMNFK